MGVFKFLSAIIFLSAIPLYTIGIKGGNFPYEFPVIDIISVGASAEGFNNDSVQGLHNWGTAHKVFSQPYPSSGFFISSPMTITSTEQSERAMFLDLTHMDYLPWWSIPINSIGIVRIKDVNNNSLPIASSVKFIQLINGVEFERALSVEYIGNNTIEIRYGLFETSLAGPIYFFIGWDKEDKEEIKAIENIVSE